MFEFKRCYGKSTEPFAIIAAPMLLTANGGIDAQRHAISRN